MDAEVRLFYNTRVDWDTEFFTATSETDLYNKAAQIADDRRADHFNCGLATIDDHKPLNDGRRIRSVAAPASVKDQVKLIENTMGKMED